MQSDVCGGLESYAIGISPPSITLAGVKSCFDRRSSVSVSSRSREEVAQQNAAKATAIPAEPQRSVTRAHSLVVIE